jgi:FtsP/CotA-like multicopper oxidase with cupredoxin domain
MARRPFQTRGPEAMALERLRDSWRRFRGQPESGFVEGDRDGATAPQRAQLAIQARQELQLPQEIRSEKGILRATLSVKYAFNAIGQDPVYLRSYNGKLTGPTLRAKPGDTLRITIKNELPDDPPAPDGLHNHLHGFNTTNLHTHGLHVSPAGKSDNVLIEIRPGKEFDYEIKVPRDHPCGTFWYHAHKHGSVAGQVSSGMSGALIIEGGLDRIDEIAAAAERIFIFQQIPYVLATDPTTGANIGVVELWHADLSFGPGTWDKLGRYTTINGQVLPVVTLNPGEVQRWRFVHSGVRESLLISLKKKPSSNQPEETIKLYEIAADGLAFGKMVPREIVEMHPGYRSDVLVKAPADEGDYLLVDERSTGPSSFLVAPEPRKYLAKVVVKGAPMQMRLPEAASLKGLEPHQSISDAELTGRRSATYSILRDNEGGIHFFIDGRGYDQAKPRRLWLGDVEEWTLRSVNFIPVNHPFHIHVNPFEVVSIKDANGKEMLAERVWRDTILIPEGWAIKIRTRYERYAGSFVQHCHILDHEDQGMMELIEIGHRPKIQRNNPASIEKPVGNLYSHGVEIPRGARVLYIAGQVGTDKEGNIPGSPDAELDNAWKKIGAVLNEAHMTFRDLVKVTCFMSNPQQEYKDAYAKSVAKFLGSDEEDLKHRPAMTAPIVKQLWEGKWNYEIEAIAAKVD